jgi:hypothetical protein
MGLFGKGYSQADVESAHAKMTGPEAKRPDGFVEVTVRELKAMRSAEYQRLNFGKLD